MYDIYYLKVSNKLIVNKIKKCLIENNYLMFTLKTLLGVNNLIKLK